MTIEQNSSRQAGKKVNCRLCRAGSLISFNWKYTLEDPESDLPRSRDLYVNPIKLKKGRLFQCKSCGSHWYLDADGLFMNYVKDDKVDTINLWSNSDQKLSHEQVEALNLIGSTPPDHYSKFIETPCKVRTKNGEIIECAIVSIQSHAPFEDWRDYRLTSEIENISASRYALPLEVRLKTQQAREMAMGFAPTVIALSNGKKMLLNGTTNFLKLAGVETNQTTLGSELVNRENMPEVYQANEKVVYFIADLAD